MAKKMISRIISALLTLAVIPAYAADANRSLQPASTCDVNYLNQYILRNAYIDNNTLTVVGKVFKINPGFTQHCQLDKQDDLRKVVTFIQQKPEIKGIIVKLPLSDNVLKGLRSALDQLPGVTALATKGAGGDKLATVLSGNETIRLLSFIDSQLTVKGVLALQNMPNLTELDVVFNDDPVTAEMTSAIAKLKNIKELSLSDNELTDEVLKPLLTDDSEHSNHLIKTLTELDLSGNKIDDAGVMMLITQPLHIEALSLSGNPITNQTSDKVVAALAHNKQLKALDISFIHMNADDETAITALADNTTLTSLNINGNVLSDANIKKFIGNTTLQQLSVGSNLATVATLTRLVQTVHVTDLDIGALTIGDSFINYQADIFDAIAANPYIKRIFVMQPKPKVVTDAQVAKLVSNKNLEWIGLDNSGVTDQQAIMLANMPGLKSLTLDFNQLSDVSALSIAAKHSPSLVIFGAALNDAMTQVGREALEKSDIPFVDVEAWQMQADAKKDKAAKTQRQERRSRSRGIFHHLSY